MNHTPRPPETSPVFLSRRIEYFSRWMRDGDHHNGLRGLVARSRPTTRVCPSSDGHQKEDGRHELSATTTCGYLSRLPVSWLFRCRAAGESGMQRVEREGGGEKKKEEGGFYWSHCLPFQ
ncbi:hypothetical protein BaRGS_00030278 [Batillaria attramentaria]|uniref:Uncharacterized protein n=1 Tax=Batillaria attramentaria TaxID=370345 RepID=A0ABD0JTZ4_9CAEN